MKKFFAMLMIFLTAAISSCNQQEESPTDSEVFHPNQEELFIITRTPSVNDCGSAAVIDVNGGYHYLPDDFSFEQENWYQAVLSSSETDSVRSIAQDDLTAVYLFFHDFCPTRTSSSYKNYEEYIADYGYLSLYMLYTDSSGNAAYCLLCRYGQSITCIDNDSVKDFVNWMCDNNYFYIADFRY